MRILMTGSRGYLGLRVYELLSSNNDYIITECDRKIGSYYEEVSGEYHVVIHLGGSVSLPEGEADKYGYINNNVVNLIHLMDHVKCNKFIFFSSAAIYNNDGLEQPPSVYGATKLVDEDYIKRYAEKHSIRYYILRIANPIGLYKCHIPYIKDINAELASVLFKLAYSYINNDIFHIHRIKDMIRDFIPMDYITQFIRTILDSDINSGIYYLGSNKATVVIPTLTTLCKQNNIIYNYIDPPPGVIKGSIFDSSKTLEILGIKELECNLSIEFKKYINILEENTHGNSDIRRGDSKAVKDYYR